MKSKQGELPMSEPKKMEYPTFKVLRELLELLTNSESTVFRNIDLYDTTWTMYALKKMNLLEWDDDAIEKTLRFKLSSTNYLQTVASLLKLKIEGKNDSEFVARVKKEYLPSEKLDS